ncbi:hypothetical protein GCM10011492_29570 [Flexivirga endophytica]|uniref:DUF349 domain-containing protein n=1 Tax=Flexivirga endophytica TaxID=1849103 RepID=A0A916WWW2_9MICO|nr:DUF349 domain-containing protein [Flexivirga endophytica]GGB36915.1 hypothetical protein GCM10011492_29570 [Flexivirga endophytica]GHB44465.1 hypothetical protein GCM10008112_11950 [Flexivirga endophytica]
MSEHMSPESPQSTDESVAPPTPVTEATEEQSTPAPEPTPEPTPETSTAAQEPATPAPAPETSTPATPAVASPRPAAAAPRPAPPSPAVMKPRPPAAAAVPQAPAPAPAATNSASFGRVAEDGTVFVRTPDGEREVGSYPDATHEEALAYFARKYDELAAAANLLLQRVVQTDLATHDGQEALRALREQIGEAHVVGDLVQLDSTVEQIATALKAKAQVEGEARAAARAEAAAQREKLVAEAEQIAAQPTEKVQWKSSTARMRALLDEWKELQRNGAKLDKPTENALWQRFSHARNGFDKTRRSHFARLDEEHSEVKARKERLIAEAERLATSKDWGQTASAFKRLMGEWRQAGRASRHDDDALWARFKKAQDSFFAAKDEVVAEENKEFEANLEVKEQLLKEAQALLPVKNLAAAKSALRSIQDRWDAAGKVPRKDINRIEQAMRKVETAVRDAEDSKWKKTDPELAARAQSMVDQLEKAVSDLETDLAKAREGGNAKKIKELEDSLRARQEWLEQARSGLQDSNK